MSLSTVKNLLQRELNKVDKEIKERAGDLIDERDGILRALDSLGTTAPVEVGPRTSSPEAIIERERGRTRDTPVHRMPASELEAIVLSALAKRPEGEWVTAHELGEQLTNEKDGGDHAYSKYWYEGVRRNLREFHTRGFADRESAAGRGAIFQYRLNSKGLQYAKRMLGIRLETPAPTQELAPVVEEKPTSQIEFEAHVQQVREIVLNADGYVSKRDISRLTGISTGKMRRILELLATRGDIVGKRRLGYIAPSSGSPRRGDSGPRKPVSRRALAGVAQWVNRQKGEFTQQKAIHDLGPSYEVSDISGAFRLFMDEPDNEFNARIERIEDRTGENGAFLYKRMRDPNERIHVGEGALQSH